jgi:hypothetical protein
MEMATIVPAIKLALNSPMVRAALQTGAEKAFNSLASKSNNQPKARRRARPKNSRNTINNSAQQLVPFKGIPTFLRMGGVPQKSVLPGGIHRVSHIENLGTLTSKGADGNTYCLFPVSCKMTPFLRDVASEYNKFRLVKLNVTYKTACTSDTHGMVVIAPFYENLDFDTLKGAGLNSLMSLEGARSCSVWQDNLGTVVFDLKRSTNNNLWLECSPGDGVETLVGFLILVNDGGGDVDIGKVFIDYTIDFAAFKPPFSADLVLSGNIPITNLAEDHMFNSRLLSNDGDEAVSHASATDDKNVEKNL